jgi:glycosyltransferase involved in cell wall biosynthesis
MKLSVAMIRYNQERFIGQAIERVLAQKVNCDYEIVIGEDCSTDGAPGRSGFSAPLRGTN